MSIRTENSATRSSMLKIIFKSNIKGSPKLRVLLDGRYSQDLLLVYKDETESSDLFTWPILQIDERPVFPISPKYSQSCKRLVIEFESTNLLPSC